MTEREDDSTTRRFDYWDTRLFKIEEDVQAVNKGMAKIAPLFSSIRLLVRDFQEMCHSKPTLVGKTPKIINMIAGVLERLEMGNREILMQLILQEEDLQKFLWDPAIQLEGQSFRDRFRILLYGERLVPKTTVAPAPLPATSMRSERTEFGGEEMCVLFFEKLADYLRQVKSPPNRDALQKIFVSWVAYLHHPEGQVTLQKAIRDFFTAIVRMPTNATVERQHKIAQQFMEVRKIERAR